MRVKSSLRFLGQDQGRGWSVGRGELRHREVKTLGPVLLSKRLEPPGVGLSRSWCPCPSALLRASQCPVPAATGPTGLQGNMKPRSSPGNNLELSWGLYSGSQNIWPRIGRSWGGRGWPMLWLPVLPSCFLLIARPSGLICDPGATGRTALPNRGQAVLAWAGAAGTEEGGRVGSLRWVLGHLVNIHLGGSTIPGVQVPQSRAEWLWGQMAVDPGEAGPSQSHPHSLSGDSGVSIFFQYLHPGSQPSPKELQVWGRQSWTQ